MKRRMEIMRDAAGRPAPQDDRRYVPTSTMAEYEDVHPTTVYARTLAGHYPAEGMKRFGRDTRYCPALCLGARAAAGAAP